MQPNEIPLKERMKISRQKMPEQDPRERITNFQEVNLGYDEETARLEAMRCLKCKNMPCVAGCPVAIKIPQFIEKVVQGDYSGAADIISEDNLLPAICGRVCPQEEQCEAVCVLSKKGESVSIGRLERFVADYDRTHPRERVSSTPPDGTGKKIAIIGSGPAGLTCAGDLIREGHEVTLFEALHEYGGVLVYGIPEFRLPKAIVKGEVGKLNELGVDFQKNFIVGITETIDELFEEGYHAVFIGVGAGLPHMLNIPGENLIGIYSSNEFLTRVNLMKAYRFPEYDTPVLDCKDKDVGVFGGGNTAMDSVRTARRLGARNAYIIYRRSEAELPARLEEYHHALEEGIQFLFLNNPLEFTGDENGVLNSVRLQRMELGEPDASGRRRPVPIPGSEYTLDLQLAVIAIGNKSNPIIQQTTEDLGFNKWGNVIVNEETMETNKKGVFAGGDIVSGGATVILAMGAGRKAAQSINQYLKTLD